MTYKVGEGVIIAAPSTSYAQQFKGNSGTIVHIEPHGPYAYQVQLKLGSRSIGFAESELSPAGFVEVVDEVNNPSHYAWLANGVEVIDITEQLNFSLGNVVKYVLRAGHKTDEPITDLRKAAWYIDREIKRLEATQ
ncbi:MULTISPECIES: DUF3310 domain-containing protein [unclassified Streptomyces]|uniref:DUF3310 domain-containing protein n=1 Tax=Streptomyces sp. NPDC055082 TaxID=3365718 RepID=UPI0037D6F3CA